MTDANDYRDKVDTDKCYFCPKRTDIEVHHIVPQRFQGSDSRSNLVALCDRCHKKIERLYDAQFYEDLGITDTEKERQNHFTCDISDCHNYADGEFRMSPAAAHSIWLCSDCLPEHQRKAIEYTDNTILNGLRDSQEELEFYASSWCIEEHLLAKILEPQTEITEEVLE